jgi:quinol monooxygenase YgiN
MFLRSMQLQISADHLWAFRTWYEESVVPALQRAAGCLYVALVHSEEAEEEVLSLTLWDEPESFRMHEKQGAFPDLVEESKGYMADSADYKIRLTPEMHLEYGPEPREPVYASYNVTLHSDISRLLRSSAPMTFVRVVHVRVRPEMTEEFARIYERDIAPTLLALPGCRLNLLLTDERDRSEHLSLTLWDNAENADAYEESGAFTRLTDKLKHTFSALYQWKLGFEREQGKQAATSDDLVVRAYHVLLAKSMQGGL